MIMNDTELKRRYAQKPWGKLPNADVDARRDKTPNPTDG